MVCKLKLPEYKLPPVTWEYRVKVDNIPNSVPDAEIIKLFNYGKGITGYKIVRDSDDTGHALVYYKHRQSSRKVIYRLNAKRFFGNKLVAF